MVMIVLYILSFTSESGMGINHSDAVNWTIQR